MLKFNKLCSPLCRWSSWIFVKHHTCGLKQCERQYVISLTTKLNKREVGLSLRDTWGYTEDTDSKSLTEAKYLRFSRRFGMYVLSFELFEKKLMLLIFLFYKMFARLLQYLYIVDTLLMPFVFELQSVTFVFFGFLVYRVYRAKYLLLMYHLSITNFIRWHIFLCRKYA